MTINISSKINHLILENCKNIIIYIGGLISGLEIIKSQNINLKIINNKDIYSVLIDKSENINIYQSLKMYKKTYYDKYKSCNICIIDKYNNKHKV